MIICFLPCANEEEATKITDALLSKKLIVCAKQTSVSSAFFWKGKTEKDNETLLILETVEEKFDEIEKEVRDLHSYETFVLTAIPVLKFSKGVREWIEEGIK